MAKSKKLKALVMSAVAMTMSASMLVGTTFAWFTDSVTSSNNVIKSGNLDVELEYWKDGDWADVNGQSDILTNLLWEPGATEVAYFRLANAGSLDFKYQFGVNIVSETTGTNVAGKPLRLSDYIYFDMASSATAINYATREAAMNAVVNPTLISTGYNEADKLEAGEEKYLAMVVYMPETVGNEANHKTGTQAPQIDLGINVVATQVEAEKDSYGDDYDAGAPWLGGATIDWYDPSATEYTLTSSEDLAGLAQIVNGTAEASTYSLRASTLKDDFKGKTIKLNSDVDLNDLAWTAIGTNANPFRGNFDGQGHTISNLNVNNEGWAGLFGHVGLGVGSTIQNVNVEGATINSNRMAGVIVGQLYGSLYNCHVSNAVIKVVPNKVGDSYDNGDKVGGIVGWLGDNGNNRVLDGCSVENVDITAYRDVAGIAGYVASSTTVSNNTVKGDNTVAVDQITNYYGDKDFNAGAVYGRTGGAITETNNQVVEDETKVTEVTSIYQENGLQYKELGSGEEKEVVFYLVPADYTGDTVTVAKGTTRIGNYAFAYNSNVKTVVMADSVRELGRAFDSSTVKKVVLNEGLKEISSRAFKSTTSLEEVVISSTVKTIADNAFQKSAIKSITIPATVKTIGETAFGSSLIEEVTFEGNTAIQGYAFRGCANLRTVYLLGDDVTFIPSTLSGKNSMWFCNGESNNPNTSNITFYVMNETVQARVRTALGAEKPETTPIIVIFKTTSNSDDLVKAINNASDGDTIVISEGNYALRFTNNVNFNVDNLNFVGNGNVNLSISSSEAWYGRIQGSKVSFTNIHFTSSVGSTGEATYNNCEFDDWTILASSNNEKTYFNDCTVKGTLNTSTDFSAGDAYMNGCTIETVEASGNATMYFENCNIGKLISWNMNMVLTNCEVETLDLSHMTTNSIIRR